MKEPIYIYIAGPYSNDPIEGTRNALLVAEALRRLGFVPYVPHLTLFWHFIAPHSKEFWLNLSGQWLKKCDCVFRLPGLSEGAEKETQLAESLGIPIWYSYRDDFDSWVSNRYISGEAYLDDWIAEHYGKFHQWAEGVRKKKEERGE